MQGNAIKKPEHPTTRYAKEVVKGKIVAGRLVRLACQRHLNDLKSGKERGITFDTDRANHALEFFPAYLRFAEGQFADEPFILQPSQEFIIGSLFGWIKRDGTRRFREAYIEEGKGNGKSPVAGGIGLYGLTADGEAAAEIYAAAVTRDQAGIVFRDAKLMAEASPKLRERLNIGEHNIAFKNSFFRPVSSEARSLDGKRVHIALIDELHEHPTAMVTDKMRKNTKSRLNSLIFEITNSGYDRESVCWKHREYSEKVLESTLTGENIDDSLFAYVCQLDPCEECRKEGFVSPKDGCANCDDWRDETVWQKVNPLLGVSVTHDYLRNEVKKALGMPSEESLTKRLNFCIWTQQDKPWIPIEGWMACQSEFREMDLIGLPVSAGLDLASTEDMASLVLAFKKADERGATADEIEIPERTETGDVAKDERGQIRRKRLAINFKVTLVPFFWLPRETLEKRKKQEYGRLYARWEQEGLLYVTEGNSIDYDAIFDKILQLDQIYGLKSAEIGFDPWNARQLSTQLLKEGFKMVEIPTQMRYLSEASKLLETLIRSLRLKHSGHSILQWNASNVGKEEDRNGNIRPVKQSAAKRIDGIAASVNALTRLMVIKDRPKFEVLFV